MWKKCFPDTFFSIFVVSMTIFFKGVSLCYPAMNWPLVQGFTLPAFTIKCINQEVSLVKFSFFLPLQVCFPLLCWPVYPRRCDPSSPDRCPSPHALETLPSLPTWWHHWRRTPWLTGKSSDWTEQFACSLETESMTSTCVFVVNTKYKRLYVW